MTARIDAALDAVADERATLRDERSALTAFDGRVAGLSTVTVSTGPPLVADPRPSGQSLSRLRTAYAETVMATPHYEAEYGDTVAESLAAEFGDDLAAAIIGGTALTPELRDAVRAATDAAQREREEFLDVLDREADSLATAADDIEALSTDLDTLDDRPLSTRSFDELHDLWTATRDLEARIDGVGLRRQETLRSHRNDLPGVPTDLCEYLYHDLSASYPVLASLADLGSRLERTRRRVERGLATTP
ncbi:DUF7260 family protein [Haloplanus natans]|uniref:DUF7260 family protein n=1 Tax=Haloplanus natans TaxID=376171 RepID=UPI0006782FEB|nr:hypothetical protein [Haloplanus natans]